MLLVVQTACGILIKRPRFIVHVFYSKSDATKFDHAVLLKFETTLKLLQLLFLLFPPVLGIIILLQVMRPMIFPYYKP